MRTRLPFAVIAAALACSLFTVSAYARARVFVASYGNDSNPCTFGSPCKTFQVAVNAVDTGGEVTVIDSAGFGPIIINKAVVVTSPAGVEAGIVPTSGGDGITIAAASTDTIVLRGLTLEGNATSNHAINVTAAGNVEIYNCAIRNFASEGIVVQSSTLISVLISETVVSDVTANSVAGIFFIPTASGANITAALDKVTIHNNFIGVWADASNAPIELQITNSHFDNNTRGIELAGGSLSLPANAYLKNVTIDVNQGSTGIYMLEHVSTYISQVTITPETALGIDFKDGVNEVFSDGTSHFGLVGGIVTFGSWTVH
jgi:hypothetical protein